MIPSHNTSVIVSRSLALFGGGEMVLGGASTLSGSMTPALDRNTHVAGIIGRKLAE